jgi:GNAT superfamily N-acetyltransferase
LWIALVMIGVVRLLAVVLAEPLQGYANQFDMARTSACIDLWPSLPVPQRYAAHQSAPIVAYVDDRYVDGACYPGTSVALAALAKGLGAAAQAMSFMPKGALPLRLFGIVQALVLIAIVLAFCRAERLRPWARLAHASVFAVVLADPANTLWANTLYTEFATMLAAYAAIGYAALAPPDRPQAVRTTAGIAAFTALAFARQQYLAFAAIPWLIVAPRARRDGLAGWLLAGAAIVAVAAVQTHALSSIPSIGAANRHDFWLGAVLPAVRDEPRSLERLGLPPACRDAIGSNWYVGMGAPAQEQCPEIAQVGRLEFLGLVASDPGLPVRVLLRGLPEAQAWWQHHLGMVAGERFADVSRSAAWSAASLASIAEGLPFFGWLLALAALPAAWVVGARGWVRSWRYGGGSGLASAVLACASLGLYALVSAIFGDGYVEVSRHAILVHASLWSLLLLGAGYAVATWPRGSPGPRIVSVAAAVVLTAAFAIVLVETARRTPMGRGVVDEPATRVVAGDRYALRGWALDPFGVRYVRVGVYDDWNAREPRAEWTATAALPTGGAESASLARYFPTYPGSERGGFAIDIPRDALAGRPSCLRVRVENTLGIRTEIDRRCVRVP